MTSLTQPLRDEHAEILPRIEELRGIADRIGDLSANELTSAVDDAHNFLAGHLIAHAEAEEVALYPTVSEVCGATEVTATMSYEHKRIGELVEELGHARTRLHQSGPDAELDRELRRLLYGLHAVIGVHFMKEEKIFLPLLDARLTQQRADEMFAALHASARETLDDASGGQP